MKYLFITILLIFTSCVDKKQKAVIQTTDAEPQKVIGQAKSEKQEVQSVFYNNVKKLKTFDFNQLPLSIDIDDISNNNTEKYNVNDKLRKDILKQANYYKLVNYSNVNDGKNIKIFTVFGNYDYYSNIILLTTNIEIDSLIDYKIIASLAGDGGNHYEKKSILKNDVFESRFTNYYRTLTVPYDTIRYFITGKSLLSIDSLGKIKEDTLSVKRNYFEFKGKNYEIKY